MGDGSSKGPPFLPIIPEGTYTEREEIARGGLGRVLRATDQSMGRVVAIKELLPDAEVEEARFVREALVTARLEHPSIVPVYEAGRWPSGEPFYTMKLVSGQSLRELVRETRALPERLALLPHVIDVAEALAYAHSKRVIHRDVKPANVVIGKFGETMVIDWGLAKDLSAVGPDEGGGGPVSLGEELTQFGDVLGTPAYMAPEQARGEAVDERADVYSLGALLYFVLSGVTPHDALEGASGSARRDGPAGATGTDFVTQVAMRNPVPLEVRRPEVPRELGAIVDKAMAREPERRYPSARELAADLKAFQTGRLVSAHRYTTWALIARWLRKNRVPVAVGGVALALLVAGGAVSVKGIVEARDVAEARAHQLTLIQARASLETDPSATVAWLKTYPAHGSEWPAARVLAGEAVARGVAREVWRPGGGPISSVQLAPDGRLAVAAGDGAVRVREGDRWRILGTVGTTGGALAFSPDGRSLAAGGNDGKVLLYPEGRVLGAHDDAVGWVAFSPDGAWVASSSVDRTVRLWPVAGGEPVVLRGHELATSAVAFSPDGKTLATGGEDATVRLWDLTTHAEVRRLHVARSVIDAAFSPDGKTLAIATRGGPMVWALAADEPRPLGDGVHGETYGVAWRGSGALITAGVDGLGVWDPGLGAVHWLAGHHGAVNAVCLSDDGTLLVSGGADGAVRVWPLRAPSGELLRSGNQPGGSAARPRVSPDRKVIAAPGEDGTIYVHRPGAGDLRLAGHAGPVREVVFSPDGARLASIGQDRTVRVWDLATGAGRIVRELPTQAFRLRFAPDGRRVALTQGFEELDILELASGDIGCVFRGHGDSASALSPDGAQIAFMDGYQVMVGNLATCQARPVAEHRGSVFGLAWSPDGRVVASASADRTVALSPAAGGEPRFLRGHAREVYGVHFSPDGALLASTGFGGDVRLWDVATGQPRRLLTGHDKIVLHAAFTPDGALLVTSGGDDLVRVWDVATGDLVQREEGTGLGGVAIAGEGRLVVSAGPYGLRLWPIDRRDAVPVAPAALERFLDQATTARIDASGQLVSP